MLGFGLEPMLGLLALAFATVGDVQLAVGVAGGTWLANAVVGAKFLRWGHGEAIRPTWWNLSVACRGALGRRVAVFGGSPAARSCGRPWCSRMCLNPCAGASVWAFPAPRAVFPLWDSGGLLHGSGGRFSTSRCCRRPRHVAPCRRCRRGLALAFCDRPAGTQILALGLLPVERLDAGCGEVEVSASFVI